MNIYWIITLCVTPTERENQSSIILTVMKTLRPAMLYRPSPTFFTFSLLHLLDGHWQCRWATLVTCCTCNTRTEEVWQI